MLRTPTLPKNYSNTEYIHPTHVDTNPIYNIENLFYLSMASDME